MASEEALLLRSESHEVLSSREQLSPFANDNILELLVGALLALE